MKLSSGYAALLSLAVAGALVKILGGFIYGSKALLVDALTSMANILALALSIHFLSLSTKPPDEDHPYGHRRLALGAPLVTLMAYSFVGGVAVTELIHVAPYRISIYASYCAAIGLALYAAVIALAKRVSRYLSTYAVFTYTELIESGITIVAAVGGALLSYFIDYCGAIAITGFIFYELVEEGRSLLTKISEYAEPRLLREIAETLRSMGIDVRCVRVHSVEEGLYRGDVTIAVDPRKSVEEVHRVADEVEKILRERFGVEVVVHVEPRERESAPESSPH